jgi:Ca-activated chloride channel family protein
MKARQNIIFLELLVLGMLLSSCQGGQLGGLGSKQVVVPIVYGSEKTEWLEPLIQQYNEAKHKTASGAMIVVEATPMGSIESVNGIISGELKPVVWSPASSVYIPVANAEWRRSHADDLVTGNIKDLVLSPVVIAMWKPMAEAMGWPSKPLGWADIATLATSPEGWAAYGYSEWGNFKFGHTHPNYSNSGLVSIIAEAYSGANKQRGLTLADLQNESLKAFMTDVEKSVIHYGTSTGFFAERMFERGPSYLSAAVLYENLIVAQENKRINGTSSQLPVVAIYPKEGTFWSNHPYAILNAPWVTTEHKEAAQDFQNFLLDRPQQLKAIELGFRPADPSIPLTSPLDAQHGVDPSQPQTVLEIPSSDVIAGVQDLWREVKKPVDLVVVMDTSGSMQGDKITSARNSLMQFINLLDERDRLEVIVFNSDIITLTELSPVGEKRQQLLNRISGIVEGGGTRLYDTIQEAYESLENKGDESHIRSIVVLSDGQDTDSSMSVDDVINQIGATGEEAGSSIKVFTIGFGDDADKDILKQIAESTGGKQYDSNPETINKVYDEIATFF